MSQQTNNILNYGLIIAGLLVIGSVFWLNNDMVMNWFQSDKGTAMTGHDHPMTEVDSNGPIPAVAVESFKDDKGGYNIHVITENYSFTPEAVNGKVVSNSGHAHLYVNGVKVARLYGSWFHLEADELQSGKNEIMVTLNANDHSEWVQDGEHIAATITIQK